MVEGVSLPHLPSEGSSSVVFWFGASLVSAVLEVLELAFKRLEERLPGDYGGPISVVITLLKGVNLLEFAGENRSYCLLFRVLWGKGLICLLG